MDQGDGKVITVRLWICGGKMKQTTINRSFAAVLCAAFIGVIVLTSIGAFRKDTISIGFKDGGTFRTVGKIEYRNGAAIVQVKKHTEMRSETKADTVRQVPVQVKRHRVIIPSERISYVTVE